MQTGCAPIRWYTRWGFLRSKEKVEHTPAVRGFFGCPLEKGMTGFLGWLKNGKVSFTKLH